MAEPKPCVVCKREHVNVADIGSVWAVSCPVCGIYELNRVEYQQMTKGTYHPLFSAWIRSKQEAGSPAPKITSLTWAALKDTVRIPTVREKQAALMKAVAQRTNAPGSIGRLTRDTDYTLAWASNDGELRFLIDDLIDRGLLDRTSTIGNSFLITTAGWDYIDNLPTSTVFSDQVFVAMSFGDSMTSAWRDGIAPAVKRAGYTPYRVDATPHIDRIDHKIMAEIKGSRFVVADVTEQKAGVYFEAGYAIGLELPVIWTVRADEIGKVHFDTRQYAHILWHTAQELEAKLYDTIVAVIGSGNVKRRGSSLLSKVQPFFD